MTFSTLSKYFYRIESTPKRLEMTEILADLIKNTPAFEIDLAIYLSLGSLAPPFRSIQFNVANKIVIRAISLAFDKDVGEVLKEFAATGDLGLAAEKFRISNVPGPVKVWPKAGKSLISIADVYEKLRDIAEDGGAGSQDRKIRNISSLLKNLDFLSRRYVVRIILGTMRLGFSDITVMEAISWFVAGNKSFKGQIEKHYRIYPDVGLLAKVVKEKGIKGIDNINIEFGAPIFSARCARIATAKEIMEKLDPKGSNGVAAEYKYDGTRIQIHLNRGLNPRSVAIKTFTRNMEESTYMFPDLIKAVLNGIDAKTAILDAEAIGIDEKGFFIPFQETIKRKRKHNIAQAVKDIPLTLRVFDVLYLNGKSLINEPLSVRWQMLRAIVKESLNIKLASHKIIRDSKTLNAEFNYAIGLGLEGLVVKNLNSFYPVGSRGFAWVKFKEIGEGGLSDNIDAIVIGYYNGAGQRSKFGIGAFLIALYDNKDNSYKTISKVGTGLTDEQWQDLKKRCDSIKVLNLSTDIKVPKELYCDVWIKPKIVVEIKADNITKSPLHTAGYALRFPRLIKYRSDKSPQEATSVGEIEKLYKMQIKI